MSKFELPGGNLCGRLYANNILSISILTRHRIPNHIVGLMSILETTDFYMHNYLIYCNFFVIKRHDKTANEIKGRY